MSHLCLLWVIVHLNVTTLIPQLNCRVGQYFWLLHITTLTLQAWYLMIHHNIKTTKPRIGVGSTSATTAILSCDIRVCTTSGATFGGVHYGTTISAWSYMLTPYTCVQQVVSMAHYSALRGMQELYFFVWIIIDSCPAPSDGFGHQMTRSVRWDYVHTYNAVECEYRRSNNVRLYTSSQLVGIDIYPILQSIWYDVCILTFHYSVYSVCSQW